MTYARHPGAFGPASPPVAYRLAGASSQSLATPAGLGLAPNGASFTVAAWFNFSSYGAYNTLVGRWRFNASLSYSLRVNWTTPQFSIGSGINTESYVSAPSPVSQDAWHLAVGWYSQPDSKVYLQVDGGAVFEQSIGFTPGTSAGDSTHIGQSGNNDEFFTGLIGPCGFWSRALGEAERALLYNNGVGRSYGQLTPQMTAGLVSWWEGGLRDRRGPNHLTAVNSPGTGPSIATPATRPSALRIASSTPATQARPAAALLMP